MLFFRPSIPHFCPKKHGESSCKENKQNKKQRMSHGRKSLVYKEMEKVKDKYENMKVFLHSLLH